MKTKRLTTANAEEEPIPLKTLNEPKEFPTCSAWYIVFGTGATDYPAISNYGFNMCCVRDTE